MDAEYICSAYNKTQFPKISFPEIAFAGRSNVGKSSLINTLVNRKKTAYVSKTPGKTRLINFFLINKKFCLVDLPGYGFAKVSNDIKLQWKELIESYLLFRTNLKLTILIIDIRHGPSKDDLLMKQWMDYNCIKYIIVATKKDKLSKNEIAKRIKQIKNNLGNVENIFLFSSLTGEGRKELLEKIEEI